MFGFLLVIGSAGFYLVCFRQYGRLNHYLMDNNRNNLTGQLLLIAQIGFRNLVFGILNSVLRFLDYPVMLATLIAVDLLFLALFTVAMTQRVYKDRFKMWIYLLLGFTKLLITTTFFIDHGRLNVPEVEAAQQILLVTQMAIFLVGVGVELVACLREVISSGFNLLSSKKHKSHHSHHRHSGPSRRKRD